MYSETNYLDFNTPQEESSLNSELPIRLKRDSYSIKNDESFDSFYSTRKLYFKRGHYRVLLKKYRTSYYHHKDFFLLNKFYTFYQSRLTKKEMSYHLPPEYNRIFSFSTNNISKMEGR
jgi:hypothetical protein